MGASRNGFELRHHHWSSDVRDLIQGLGLVKELTPAMEDAPTQASASVVPFAARHYHRRRIWPATISRDLVQEFKRLHTGTETQRALVDVLTHALAEAKL